EFRTDAGGNVQTAVGKISFSEEDLKANIEAFLEHIKALKPATLKGHYLEGAVVSPSMGPGITLAVEN
ncbi:MAG TPA: 50S ribosomal protein L1, partial [Planctomycetota bacterium]|nr:50S ribosomal protein L1 [Planctomycetota bacterium]